jgi:hypothetical protein
MEYRNSSLKRNIKTSLTFALNHNTQSSPVFSQYLIITDFAAWNKTLDENIHEPPVPVYRTSKGLPVQDIKAYN